MIKEEDVVEIGKFQKTHALRGELNAILDVEPEYLEDHNPLIVVMDGIRVPFYANSVRPKGTTSYLIKLDGVDGVDEADGFVNKPIYGLRKDLAKYYDVPEEEIVFDSDLIGYDVVDRAIGNIGKVMSIDDSTMNALLVVYSPEGEVYIPYNEDFIDSIDDEGKKILMDLPEGLVHLNKKNN